MRAFFVPSLIHEITKARSRRPTRANTARLPVMKTKGIINIATTMSIMDDNTSEVLTYSKAFKTRVIRHYKLRLLSYLRVSVTRISYVLDIGAF